MNKREWLVSQGLAQGTRGRFSKEAEEAWRNHLGETADQEDAAEIQSIAEPDNPYAHLPRDGFHLALPPITKPVIREQNLAYSIDDRGTIIAHGDCGKCHERINRCDCGGPWSPKWIDPEQRPYLLISEAS
jgi:hypothetical protein